jgi:hypothetical protein
MCFAAEADFAVAAVVAPVGVASLRAAACPQDLMRERFNAVIEDATGRRVIGFMSGNQQDPDIMCEVFILSGTDLVDDHEIAGRGRTFDG